MKERWDKNPVTFERTQNREIISPENENFYFFLLENINYKWEDLDRAAASFLFMQVCLLDGNIRDGNEVGVSHTTGTQRLGYPHLDPKPKLPPHIRIPFKVTRVFFK